jgi:centrosomal protein CEP104
MYEITEENNTVCEFCDKFDENFLDPNKFDMHLWKECVMLGTCELCL